MEEETQMIIKPAITVLDKGDYVKLQLNVIEMWILNYLSDKVAKFAWYYSDILEACGFSCW